MTKVSHTIAPSSSEVSVSDGQILVQSDTGKLYVDLGDSRIHITDVEYVSSYPVAPVSDRLYVTSTGARLYHSGSHVEFSDTAAISTALAGKADLVGGKVPASELPAMDYIPTNEKNAANGVLQLDGNAMVSVAKLPVAVKGGDKGILTIASAAASSGLNLSNGLLNVATANKNAIDNHNGGAQPIGTGNLLYAVRSVLPKITVIPSATTTYSLLDASAKTNEHSYTYAHVPDVPSTYVFPDVIDDTIVHLIDIVLAFNRYDRHSDGDSGSAYAWKYGDTVAYTDTATPTEGTTALYSDSALTASVGTIVKYDSTAGYVSTCLTYSFEDSQGAAITPLFTPTISAGDVYEFRCEWSSVQSRWLVYPHKQGAVSDDYVMQSKVGAANGVAGLDGNGLVPRSQLKVGGEGYNSTYADNLGVLGFLGGMDSFQTVGGFFAPKGTSDAELENRTSPTGIWLSGKRRPVLYNALDRAVTQVLAGKHPVSLTDAQQATAQGVLGVYGTLRLDAAPTTSTVGAFGQHAIDTTTGKEYTCQGATNTGTEAEPVWSYTWVDDVNSKGGTFTGNVEAPRYNITSGAYITDQNINIGGSDTNSINGSYGNLALGRNNTIAGDYGCIVAGSYNTVMQYRCVALGERNSIPSAGMQCTVVTGKYNAVGTDYMLAVGNGTSSARHNALELDAVGNLLVAGGYRQEITAIPSATTAYVLTEGVQSHIPSSASTYTLPSIPQRIIADGQYFTRNTATDGTGYYGWLSGTTNRYTSSATPAVGDNTYTNTALNQGAKAVTAIDERTHECILTVRFSASVLTYAFEDSAGNTITPLPLAGTIANGSVVAFRCTWEALLGQWVIMPVMLGTYTAP